ncbi:hypothetical protein DEO72_LG7g2914 [Vigna unguiculata]|uniref:Bifunctional inhibitor/plant lipid transfer protein/seed storage helical domain-containing protein n=2 Tax=Vigna unguiculata TaxID=3917 RepID=A0A4D6MP51_VIGUN|nr:hypothetical protein DEO72_LG7g2914 [Vigna unguiculata]
MKPVFVSFFTLLVLVFTVAAKEPSKGLTCDQEKTLVAPCVDFLTKKTDTPATPCCEGLKKIIESSPTKKEKKAACKCLKEAASQVPNLDKDRANNLCKTCKITVDFLFSKNFECEK